MVNVLSAGKQHAHGCERPGTSYLYIVCDTVQDSGIYGTSLGMYTCVDRSQIGVAVQMGDESRLVTPGFLVFYAGLFKGEFDYRS